MRTKQEVNHAVAILRQKGDRLSLVQAAIIEERRTENWVFVNYVQNVSKEEKDESTFFAARDAARYLAGGITLEELIPDADQYPVVSIETPGLPAPEGVLQMLIKRIDALEKQVNDLELARKNLYKTIIIARPGADHLTQANAYRYIGCDKSTLQLWAKKGMITRYLSGRNVYYSKSEIDRNATIQAYKSIPKHQNKPEP